MNIITDNVRQWQMEERNRVDYGTDCQATIVLWSMLQVNIQTQKFTWNKNKRISKSSKSLTWLLNVHLCSFPSGGVYLSKIIQAKARLFTRNIRDPGAAFEYVVFANKKEQRCVCIFQAGHLLEGPPGWDNTLLSKLIEVCAFHVVILHSLCHPLSQQLSSKPKVAEINGKK